MVRVTEASEPDRWGCLCREAAHRAQQRGFKET